MSKTYIKKNIELSLELDKYLFKHTDVLAKIPRGAYVVITVKGDEKFSRDSRDLATRSKKGNQKWIEARKEGRHWSLQPLKV